MCNPLLVFVIIMWFFGKLSHFIDRLILVATSLLLSFGDSS